MMRFHNQAHRFDCGIDLSARRVLLGKIVSGSGNHLQRLFLALAAGLAVSVAQPLAAGEKRVLPPIKDPATEEMTRALLHGPQGYFRQVTFSPDGKLAAAGLMLGSTVSVWQVNSGKEIFRLQMPDKNYDYHLAFSSDGRTLVSEAREDKMIRTWDLGTGKQVREFPKQPTNFLAFAPGGRLLAATEQRGFRGTISLVDVKTGKPVRQLRPDNVPGAKPAGFDNVAGCTFSPDGKLLATHAGSGAIALWDVATGDKVRQLRESDRFGGGAFAFAFFSPDGKHLATGGHIDKSLRVWEVATGKERLQLVCKGFFVSAAFSPDGNTLATGSTDGLMLYDLAKGKEICALKPRYTGQFVVFSPDGSLLAIAGGTGHVKGEAVVTLLNAPRTRPDAPSTELTEEALESLWTDLTTENDFRLQQVLAGLRAAPRHVIPFLARKVRPIPAEQKRHVEQLITALDDDQSETREKSMEALQQLAAAFEPLLAEVRKTVDAGETRNRLTFVLRRLKETDLPRPLLAELRALGVLEEIGTPEARKVLEAIASGAARARLTEEARVALDRLARKTPATP